MKCIVRYSIALFPHPFPTVRSAIYDIQPAAWAIFPVSKRTQLSFNNLSVIEIRGCQENSVRHSSIITKAESSHRNSAHTYRMHNTSSARMGDVFPPHIHWSMNGKALPSDPPPLQCPVRWVFTKQKLLLKNIKSFMSEWKNADCQNPYSFFDYRGSTVHFPETNHLHLKPPLSPNQSRQRSLNAFHKNLCAATQFVRIRLVSHKSM